MRVLAHIVAWACLLAMAAVPFLWTPAYGEELRVYYEPARTEWSFQWDEATGPVYGYEVCTRYVCGDKKWESCQGSMDNLATVPHLEWVVWYVIVRAMDDYDGYGDWSEPSVRYAINPLRGDADLNCAVGMSDFSLVMAEWGRVSTEIPNE
jgi:hypothetical protein